MHRLRSTIGRDGCIREGLLMDAAQIDYASRIKAFCRFMLHQIRLEHVPLQPAQLPIQRVALLPSSRAGRPHAAHRHPCFLSGNGAGPGQRRREDTLASETRDDIVGGLRQANTP